MEILKLNEMLNDHRKLIKISKNSVGCGLGLTISNVIVKKMSGKGISFESSQNKETKGSRFTFISRSS
jgi:signal transduction histidine kinase